MRLSVSNIAWQGKDDEAVHTLLAELQYDGIDIAPGRVFQNPFTVTKEAVKVYKSSLPPYNLKLGGMQSLLYQKNDLTIFDASDQRQETVKALKVMIDLGAALEVNALVFGSPKNRLMGEASPEKYQIAQVFFGELADYALEQGLVFALEPNPAIYGGDFLLTTNETTDFVESVGSAGLKINLDVGALIANNELERVLAQLPSKIGLIGHVHLSRPHLKPLVIDESQIAVIKKLKEVGYEGWIAIEMLTNIENPIVEQRTMLEDVRKLTRL